MFDSRGPIFTKKSTLKVWVILALLLAAVPVITQERFTLAPEILDQAAVKYGEDARQRLVSWETLIRRDDSSTEQEKLDKVNHFFNKMEFVDDSAHWGRKDYWATPVEFLSSSGGDCEDFAVAKYFTLKAMGVPEKKLNLTYVKAVRLNQAHMVLTYYNIPGTVPLVLDNLTDEIKPATQRPDLIPIYSFNGTGLWLAKQRGRGKLLGGSDRLKRWQELMERMPPGTY
ncbi:MAG: transglutaminase-like cysteine peptidase [Pseudomonadota bacterium]